jgi:voltage-gated potassium channel
MGSLRFRFGLLLALLMSIIVVASLGFCYIEGMSPLDAFYFSVVTITTVGYGDIHVVSPAGKLFVIFVLVLGVGTFVEVAATGAEMILNRRERQTCLRKMNMLIGVFYSEVGTKLLVDFANADPNIESVRSHLHIHDTWTEKEFAQISARLRAYECDIAANNIDLSRLADFMRGKRSVLVGLLQSPLLIEHEVFSDLLRAVFHLAEELACRADVNDLPSADRAHLENDMKRAYRAMVQQWIEHMKFLKEHYPYLFSLALRTSPFDREASPIIT